MMTRKWLSIFLFVALAGAFAVSTSIALRYVGQAMDRGAYFEPSYYNWPLHLIHRVNCVHAAGYAMANFELDIALGGLGGRRTRGAE